ncbi:hypothetical protein BH23GEM3_BH23GEM3_15090 [soil metagenome]
MGVAACLIPRERLLLYRLLEGIRACDPSAEQHDAVGKESGKTSYVERFNLTARQRISRLERKTLSFS